MVQRIREKQIKLRVTEQEYALIREKMALLGIKNQEAYLRKMALDGYVLKLEIPELKELLPLAHRASSNINQIARHANETGRVYEVDISEVVQQQESIEAKLAAILAQLSKLG